MIPEITDLTAYVLQTALLLGVGLLLPTLFRLRDARACLAYWQGLLVLILLLPLIQPEPGRAGFAAELAVMGVPDLVAERAGSWSVQRVLLAALAAGAVARLAWLGIGLRALRSWRLRARPAELAPEVESVVALIGARARVLVSERTDVPVTFGWRDPVVLLPAAFAELPAGAQRGIVCHELLHVRRRDWAFALFEEGVRALLWFHPAVWMLLGRIALSREQVVDREVVRLTGSRRAYLEALRAVAFQPARQAAVPGLPFFHRGHLRERVVHLCKEVSMSRPRIATLVTTFAGVLALTTVLGILAFPMTGTSWAASEPIDVVGDVQRPQAVSVTPPTYPESARADKIAGVVILQTVIDERGFVTSSSVAKSSGNADLDQAALDAASTWTFKPATLEGKPVAVNYTLTINFTLDE